MLLAPRPGASRSYRRVAAACGASTSPSFCCSTSPTFYLYCAQAEFDARIITDKSFMGIIFMVALNVA